MTLQPSLFDLMLEESRAAFNEKIHQETCRARAEGRECLACMQYEADWLAASDAVTRFLDGYDGAEAWGFAP